MAGGLFQDFLEKAQLSLKGGGDTSLGEDSLGRAEKTSEHGNCSSHVAVHVCHR